MRFISILIGLSAAATATPAFACASCGCTLTSDWLSQGLVVQPGTTVGVRADYVPQTKLRIERREVTSAESALPANREVERYTYNTYVTATLDRQFDSDWGVNVQLPFIHRPHSTFAQGDTEASYARTQGVGDVRITARWQGFKTPGCINGLQIGVVLPTGPIHQRFGSGPTKGAEVDRGLQPGTGTVQALVGYYLFGKLTNNFDYIVQVQAQIAIDSRDEYKPGTSGQLSTSLHYTRWRGITPQFELNLRASAKDSGLNSDRENSGGEQLYAAPGLIIKLTGPASAYGYVQLPIYRRVNGFQLAPPYTATVGVQFKL